MFLNAYDSPGTPIKIEQQIYDSKTNKLWPKVDKEIGIRLNHETGIMKREPKHESNFGFNRSTQNNVLDKLIKGYNSADNKNLQNHSIDFYNQHGKVKSK